MKEPVRISDYSAKFGDHRHSGSGDIIIFLANPPDQSTNWLYGLEPLKISHHSTKFGSHRHCGSGDNGVSLSCDLARPCGKTVMWLYG